MTNPILSNSGYLYDSTVDENGTLYILETENNAILSVTAAGVVTTLPVTGLNSPRGVGIDGAGILYIADQKPENSITTYDTVQGVQGGIPYPSGAFYVQNVTAGNEGNIYATDSASIYTIKPDGTTSSVAISPANTQASRLTVDSNEDLFIGGYAINEITAGGTQTQINTAGAGDGLSVDAALTLYACRYSGYGSDSVGELPASGYGTEEAVLDSAANPLGCSDAPMAPSTSATTPTSTRSTARRERPSPLVRSRTEVPASPPASRSTTAATRPLPLPPLRLRAKASPSRREPPAPARRG